MAFCYFVNNQRSNAIYCKEENIVNTLGTGPIPDLDSFIDYLVYQSEGPSSAELIGRLSLEKIDEKDDSEENRSKPKLYVNSYRRVAVDKIDSKTGTPRITKGKQDKTRESISARNPDSCDHWWDASFMKIDELNEGEQTYIQEQLAIVYMQGCLIRSKKNATLVKKEIEKANAAAAATTTNAKSKKRARNNNNNNNDDDENDYALQPDSVMRAWPLPRRITLVNSTLNITVYADLLFLDSPWHVADKVHIVNILDGADRGIRRSCEFHRIVSVEPADCKFSKYVGLMFSSLDVSCRVFNETTDILGSANKHHGYKVWKDKELDCNLETFAEHGGFLNPPLMSGEDYRECRDYCASLCGLECTTSCLNGGAVCTHLNGYLMSNSYLEKNETARRPMTLWFYNDPIQRAKLKYGALDAEKKWIRLEASNEYWKPHQMIDIAKKTRTDWKNTERNYDFVLIDGLSGDVPDDEPISDSTVFLTTWRSKIDSRQTQQFEFPKNAFPDEAGNAHRSLVEAIKRL